MLSSPALNMGFGRFHIAGAADDQRHPLMQCLWLDVQDARGARRGLAAGDHGRDVVEVAGADLTLVAGGRVADLLRAELGVLDGELDKLLDALIQTDQAERLANLDADGA